MKRTVRELIGRKNTSIIPSIAFDATVRNALVALEEFNSGLLLVMKTDNLVGVFSERDFARWSLRSTEPSMLDAPLAKFIQLRVIFVTQDYRLEECMAVMSKAKIRHLPVMENDKPIALLSMSQIMEALVQDKEFQIDELEKYITGSNYFHKTTDEFQDRRVQFMETEFTSR